MRITNIAFTNVKGLTASLALSPLTVITAGDNHARKTAVVDGIKAGLLGYHPALGKRHPETFRLSSGSPMVIAIDFDTGEKLTRTWAPKKDTVGLESTGDPPPGMLAVLDTAAFIGANPKTRLAMLAHVATGKPIDALKAHFKAWAALLPGVVEGDPIDTAIEFRTAAETRAKVHKEGATRQAAAIATLAAKETSDRLVSPDELSAASSAVQNARTAAQAARGRAEALERAQDAASDASATLEALGDLPTWTDYSEAIAAAHDAARKAQGEYEAADRAHRALLDEKEALTRKMGGYAGSAADSLGQRIDELDAHGPASAIKAKAAALEAEATEIDKQMNGITSNGLQAKRAIQAATQKLAELDKLEECPFCKGHGPDWKENLQAAYHRDKEDAESTAANCEKEWRALSPTLKDKRAQAATLRETETSLLVMPALQFAFDAAQALTLIEPRLSAAKELRDGLNLAWGAAQNAAEDLAEKQREQTARKEDISKAADLKKIITQAPAPEDLEAAYEAVRSAENVQETVERSETELAHEARRGTAAATIRDQLSESREALATAKESQGRMEELKTAIGLALEVAIHDTYKPIIEGAKAFGADVWEGELCTIDNELGVVRGVQFVPFEILSGTEQAVITAAIQATLSKGGLVLIDELSRMVPKRKAAFAANLTRAIESGALSQVILIDYDKAVWSSASNRHFKMIDLDAI